MEDADFLALDFGASSARAIAGKLIKKKLEFQEIYRFKTGATNILGSLHWDILNFYNEIKKALRIQAKKSSLKSLGIDTWGVDFVLLDKNGHLVSKPFHYRDHRTDGIMDVIFKDVPKEDIFNITGIQFMQLNSLFQLYSMKRDNSPLLKDADTFLMIADFFNYLFTGKKVCEYTNASTTQLLDLQTKEWSDDLIKAFNFPQKIFPEIVAPGTKLGNVLPIISKETGINKDLTVIAPATHDTGSAIAAVPSKEKDFIYISSGTWALLGTELDSPNISEKALRYNFTNEGGVFKTIRFLKNITGFWLLQECKRVWEEKSGVKNSFSQLTKEAIKPEIKPFSFLIYPDHHDFLNPDDMPATIQNYCKKTGQQIPNKKGEFVRCILESIAFRYREVCDNLKEITGKSYNSIHIIGGGAQNSVLSQFTANINNLNVITGPIEATAIGNLLLQAYGMDEIKSLTHLREIVRNSIKIREYNPENISFWNDGYIKYKEITKKFSNKFHF